MIELCGFHACCLIHINIKIYKDNHFHKVPLEKDAVNH